MALLAPLVITGTVQSDVAFATRSSVDATAWRIHDVQPVEVDGEVISLSPDGAWLAGIGPDGTACVWTVDTFEPRCSDERLPIAPSAVYPTMAWSPDSAAVAFQLDFVNEGYDSDILVFDVEDATVRNLIDDGFDGRIDDDGGDRVPYDRGPSWSPDGSQLVFTRSDFGAEEAATSIMRIAREGGDPVEVVRLKSYITFTPFSQIDTPPRWTGDDVLVFSQTFFERDNPSNGIWEVALDGSGLRQVATGDRDAVVPLPAVVGSSPDGLYVAVLSLSPYDDLAPDGSARFGVFDRRSGRITALPLLEGDIRPLLPATPAGFSPNGTAALAVYRPRGADRSGHGSVRTDDPALVVLDPTTGRTSIASDALDVDPRQIAPMWAADGTVLIRGVAAPVLATLEHTEIGG